MKIVFLGNNWVGWQVLQWLQEQKENIVGLVIHPPHKQKYIDKILRVVDIPAENIFDGSKLHEPRTEASIRSLAPDMGISVFFDYILKPEFINLFTAGIINLHPSYLPYNRGQYPNVWSIIDETPAGVTLHFVDEQIDSGDIIAQRKVAVEPTDTGETLYRKLEKECVYLFQSVWPLLKSGRAPRLAQPRNAGTYRKRNDTEKIDCIDLDRVYTARELINVIRARTFPPYRGAYFKADGKKIYMRLHLTYEGEEEPC